MEIYVKLFEVIFPVFFIIGIGYFIGKKDKKFDTKFITNLTNISLDKSFIREITSYNNNNVFQIMTKSYSKMINNINNYPDEEELSEIKLIQNKDAQKWVSKYMN